MKATTNQVEAVPAAAVMEGAQPSRAALRLRAVIQTSIAVSFLLLFGLVITGVMSQQLSANPFTTSDDPWWNSLNPYQGLIRGFHRWGGIGLALGIAVSAGAMWRLGTLLGGGRRAALRPIAVAIVLVALCGTIFTHVTGVVAGRNDFRTASVPTTTVERGAGKAEIIGDTYLEPWREPHRAEAYEWHTSFAPLLLIAATALMMAGSIATSISVRKQPKDKASQS